MKRYGNLWQRLVSWENLVLAAHKAQRGKRHRSGVQRFNFALEENLLQLRGELEDGTYLPGAYHSHWITRPKPRLISAAPYRDRVVHHAIMNVLEPLLERHFHFNSYACRKGRGTHRAASRLQALMRRNAWLVQCDVEKFFPSIDHKVLKSLFRRRFKDGRVLALMDCIVDHANPQPEVLRWFPGDNLFTPGTRRRGLPIGNLTSQWFANWMLDGLDHLVTSHLGVGAYVRYCDDFVLLADSRQVLEGALGTVQRWMDAHRLRLHRERLHLRRTDQPLRFVGYRIGPQSCKLPRENVRAFRRRVRWMQRAYSEGTLSYDGLRTRIDSWLGHARHADTAALVRALSRDWKFCRR